jgi:hypothetical protein
MGCSLRELVRLVAHSLFKNKALGVCGNGVLKVSFLAKTLFRIEMLRLFANKNCYAAFCVLLLKVLLENTASVVFLLVIWFVLI